METNELRLQCVVAQQDQIKSNYWKTCVWKRNSDNATCIQKAINEVNTEMEECDTSIKNAVKVGKNVPTRYECEMVFPSAAMKDTGTWTCILVNCKDIHDGGCNADRANDCLGASSSVNVTVSIILFF